MPSQIPLSRCCVGIGTTNELLPIMNSKPKHSLLHRVAKSKCATPWAAMPGDDRVRKCPSCHSNVYQFAGLTEPQMIELITLHEPAGDASATNIARRRDGTFVPSAIACPKAAENEIARMKSFAIGFVLSALLVSLPYLVRNPDFSGSPYFIGRLILLAIPFGMLGGTISIVITVMRHRRL
jgi:hypothetical protein